MRTFDRIAVDRLRGGRWLLRPAQRSLFVLLAGSLLAAPALAGNVYLGGGWGKATYTIEGPDARADTQDSGFKLYAGYRAVKWFGVEAAYSDLLSGRQTSMGVDFSVAVNYWSAAAVGLLPVHPRFELWAKVEATRWNTDVTLDDGISPPVGGGGTGTGLGYGVGFDWYALRRVGIRVEWESFDFDDVVDVHYVSGGMIFRFGAK